MLLDRLKLWLSHEEPLDPGPFGFFEMSLCILERFEVQACLLGHMLVLELSCPVFIERTMFNDLSTLLAVPMRIPDELLLLFKSA